MTPYQYAANNPIIFIDINGDSIDFSILMKVDEKLGNGIMNNLTNDLQDLTGLSLCLEDNGQLNFAKDGSGTPIINGGS